MVGELKVGIMARIEDVDKNFIMDGDDTGLHYISAFTEPIRITGLAWLKENGNFYRLKPEHLPHVNKGMQELYAHTPGAQVCFKTNSPRVSVKAKNGWNYRMQHMAINGSSGIDVYLGSGTKKQYFKTVFAGVGEDSFGAVLSLDGKEHEFTLNLPLYSGIDELLIGLEENASLKAPTKHRVEKPVVFYGSSITQGACASRPGLAYFNALSRWLDFAPINFGFSGSARGEEYVARFLAELEMSVFVMDYDHNAPDAAYLQKTHEPFFRIIREKNPDLPVVFVSLPNRPDSDPECMARKQIILNTYHNALAAGDTKVWFADGSKMWGKTSRQREFCTVDGLHPNDMGFYGMAKGLYPILKEILKTL